MELVTKAPRGTQDILNDSSYKWQFIENTVREISGKFGFKEIRVPTFEHTELFLRGVGDTTDVVQKEMYTFLDKGNRSITLRPEGTAGVARAVIENGLLAGALPLKLNYVLSCFRYEKPQAGRLREFHQFGCEMFGTSSPLADVEMISVANEIISFLGIKNIVLNINSLGCPECRKDYTKALIEYFESQKDKLCETCNGRLEKNPMRILDCKSPVCTEISAKAPTILEFLCDDCQTHFNEVQDNLKVIGIPFGINPKIVRGLDYYTRTVFEFVSNDIGSQGTVCGGGRYDGLIEELGGKPTPALGFGMGIERILLVMENQNIEIPKPQNCQIFIGSMGEKGSKKALELTSNLRKEGFYAECDIIGRSVKAQMKYADKIGAEMSMIIGDNEVEANKGNLKNMITGEVKETDFNDIASAINEKYLDETSQAIDKLLNNGL